MVTAMLFQPSCNGKRNGMDAVKAKLKLKDKNVIKRMTMTTMQHVIHETNQRGSA